MEGETRMLPDSANPTLLSLLSPQELHEVSPERAMKIIAA
jgi:hypothetical protein